MLIQFKEKVHPRSGINAERWFGGADYRSPFLEPRLNKKPFSTLKTQIKMIAWHYRKISIVKTNIFLSFTTLKLMKN
jgi:hypothetical protein